MTDSVYLSAVRDSYDTVAESYASLVPGLFAGEAMAVGRGMLGAFAELVGDGAVADLGCGPGHVTAYLDKLGLRAFGVDLSPKQVEIARHTYPSLRFDVGSMTGLELADGALAGIVSWWSIVHMPPDELPVVFAEFVRTLAPGGYAILGFRAGDERRRPEQAYGHPVTFDYYSHPPDRVTELLTDAGLTVTARLSLDGAKPSAILLASKISP